MPDLEPPPPRPGETRVLIRLPDMPVGYAGTVGVVGSDVVIIIPFVHASDAAAVAAELADLELADLELTAGPA